MISEKDLERYSRQIIIPNFDEEGQEIILSTRILIIGAGGLGCSTALYSSAVGFGKIDIIDHDKIEISNLNRQIAFSTDDIGKFKSEILKYKCLKLNPSLKVNAFNNKFDLSFSIDNYDIVLDCSDNVKTRYEINQLAHKKRKVFIHGAATQFEGQMGIFKSGINDVLPCYECLFPRKSFQPNNYNCREVGIIGSITNFISSLQVTEAIRESFILKGYKNKSMFSRKSLSGYIFLYNGLEQEINKIKVNKNNKCVICG